MLLFYCPGKLWKTGICLNFAGFLLSTLIQNPSPLLLPQAPSRYEFGPMFGQCWASVVDGGPTFIHYWANVLYFVGLDIPVNSASHPMLVYILGQRHRPFMFFCRKMRQITDLKIFFSIKIRYTPVIIRRLWALICDIILVLGVYQNQDWIFVSTLRWVSRQRLTIGK